MDEDEIDYLKRNNVSDEDIKHFNEILNYWKGHRFCVICGKEAMTREYIDGEFQYYCDIKHRRRDELFEDIRKLFKE